MYDRLCDMYEGDVPAPLRRSELMGYIESSAAALPAPRTGHDFPEILEIRQESQVELAGEPQDGPGVLFVRLRGPFERQLGLKLDPETGPISELVGYRVAFDDLLLKDLSSKDLSSKDLSSKDLSSRDRKPALWIQSLDPIEPPLRPDDIVAVWYSAYRRRPSIIDELPEDVSAWLICDVSPLDLIRATRRLIPELRVEWRPSRDGSPLGASVALQVGSMGRLDGIVFPSSNLTSHLLGPVLIEELGDNLRSLGGVVPLHGNTARRADEATFLAEWITRTELSFSFTEDSES